MILIGVGANLPGPLGDPRTTCEAALAALERAGVGVVARSRWWRTAPVPASSQPWFINGVAAIDSDRGPVEVLDILHAVEHGLGRVRTVPNAARVIDMDLLAYHELVHGGAVELPHPRMHQRSFVLYPLAEVAPHWHHPLSGASVTELIAALPSGQVARPEP